VSGLTLAQVEAQQTERARVLKLMADPEAPPIPDSDFKHMTPSEALRVINAGRAEGIGVDKRLRRQR
jgi:hypothetical protein